MCGRYYLKATPADLATHFDVDVRDNFPPRYNIAPTQPIAVVRMNDQRARSYSLMRWGFIPSWAKGEHLERFGSKPLINARSETAAEKPSFRHAFRRRRCLVPADGFYEWAGKTGDKQPYNVSRDGLFAFAGIWETAIGLDGGEADTVAILTTPSGADMRPVYAREPVVIEPEDYTLWLGADERDTAEINSLLHAAKKGTWTFRPVSKDVGNTRNDGPHLIEPATLL